ncbi:MAG: glycoside hydrolase family 2 TIM barrel-domain containing protein [Candidatus Promineifilaceae bacterium]|nr:glycoside hydrolase family 2 TIM barrel-domain containing protein [Candidatus Promineifilaceae bacterium]
MIEIRPQRFKSVVDLGGTWRYITADAAEFAAADWDDSEWPQMTIPQNWFLAGLDYHGVVWFRRSFDVDLAGDQYATLRFDGVDYFADVYLNGRLLGRHEGYFEPFVFEVGDLLRNGRNTLAVRVDSPFEEVGLQGWHMRKRLIKGVLNHHDCRPGGGWVASGQAYNTGGIWNRVTLEFHWPITIEQMLLQADLESSPAQLSGELVINNRTTQTAVSFQVNCAPANFEEGQAYAAQVIWDLAPGTARYAFSMPVPEVKRWQPWDRGFPHLYQVSVSSATFGAAQTAEFGFRSVAVDDQYRWRINGQSYFPRGSNYIASQWLAETLFPAVAAHANHPFKNGRGGSSDDDESWFERDVRLMRAANLNMIRVHAHVLPPEFHTACDRAGLLVWQDFPFQWGYSDASEFHEEAERQLRAMIALLFNHPSIVSWCIHNESPWDADWMAEEAGGSYEPGHNRTLDERLYEAARSLDAGRHVQMNSGTGDGHVYPGWYYGHWRDYAGGEHGAPFPTEYGAQGIPVLESTQAMFAQFGVDAGHAALRQFKAWIDKEPTWALAKDMPPLDQVPADLRDAYKVWKTWRFHDFQPPETFYMAGIDLGESLQDFIDHSQAYQNQIVQYATETYRQHKYSKINGLMHFMFVEPWPAVTWAVVDYWRRPKPAYAVLRTVMQPLLITACLPLFIDENEAWRFDLLAINDLQTRYEQTLCRWQIVNRRMETRDAGTVALTLGADSLSDVVHVTAKALSADTYRLILTLHEKANLLSQNSYTIQVRKS